jgi:hypothetical protein
VVAVVAEAEVAEVAAAEAVVAQPSRRQLQMKPSR